MGVVVLTHLSLVFFFSNFFSFSSADVMDVYSSHGCPLSCPRVMEEFTGGKYGSTCNGPFGTCVSGDTASTNTVGEPTCVCDSTKGWIGPKCDKQCPITCNNGHCGYDPVLDTGRCFCNLGYGGATCEVRRKKKS